MSIKEQFIAIALLLASQFIIAQVSTSPSQDAEIATKIETYLSQSVRNGYSSSVLVARDGEILISEGYGLANRSTKLACKPSTVYNIGSVTKQFTAAAILKLVENGKLKLTDNIGSFFKQASLDKKYISIHQLLTHTSGISPGTGGFRYDEASMEEFLNEFFESRLMYEPGTKHTYANANYIILAAIIELIANQTYESFLKENFWEPLEMDRTGYNIFDFDNADIAHGYYFHYTSGEWKDWGITPDYMPQSGNHWYSIGKGDLYSTVEDLYTWHQALQENKVLSETSRKIIETAHVPENDDETSFYGYGWAIFHSKENKKIVTHNGSNGIYFADFIRVPEENVIIIVLSNSRLNRESESVAWEILRMLDNPQYQPKTVPKNTYELVFDFMKNHSAESSDQLPAFIENSTGNAFNDKAVLNRIGFKQISENGDSEWGISLLELNTKLFPDDGNLHDSLGEGYFIVGNLENAEISFRKALELGKDQNCHWCENSENRLKEIMAGN